MSSSDVFEDRSGLDFFTTTPDGGLDSLFDFNFEAFQCSSDTNSNESSNFFDELSNASSGRGHAPFELTAPTPLSGAYKPNHLWRADAFRHHTAETVPKSQRVAHKLRKDDIAITGSELLSLEGRSPKTRPDLSSPLKSRASLSNIASQQKSRPASPRGGRTHRVSKTPSTPALAVSGRSKTMQPSGYYTAAVHQRASSLEDGFQRFNIQPRSRLDNITASEPVRQLSAAAQNGSPNVVQNANFEHFATSNVYAPNVNGYQHSHLAQSPASPWDQRYSTVEYPLDTTQLWNNQVSSGSNMYEDGSFAHSQASSVPYGLGIDTSFGSNASFSSNGLGIQYADPFDDPFAANAAFVEPQMNIHSQFDPDNSDSSSNSPSNSHVRHFSNQSNYTAATSPPMSPHTPISVSKQRRRSSRPTKSPRTPRTPKTPSSKGGSMSGGFVNFTPHDSKRILTGVAPSGSSKTKARREREASEKRKKWTEAAAKAVVKAGGNVDELMKEGLLPYEVPQ
jgi:hypothetical protein